MPNTPKVWNGCFTYCLICNPGKCLVQKALPNLTCKDMWKEEASEDHVQQKEPTREAQQVYIFQNKGK